MSQSRMRFPLFVAASFAFCVSIAFGQLTLNIGAPAPPPTTLVAHTNAWRYHKGTNAPVGGWQTLADGLLGAQWPTGNGGFGYSTDTPAETNNCRTILSDMQSRYTTLYMRHAFEITNTVDTNAQLQLTMDYDDAFVAYLDGVEIRRGGSISGGTTGVEPPHTALASATHESSLGSSGNAPSVYNLGAVSNRLAVGTHVLAIIGLNGTTSGSSDFIMVPTLSLLHTVGGTAQNGTHFSIVSGSSVVVTGANVVANSARVTVNGDDAVMTAGNTAWAKTNALAPGVNRIFVASLGTNGSLLASTNRLIISEVSSTSVSGSLSGSNYWSSAMGIIRVTGTVTVAAGASLTIAPGTVVLFNSGAGLTVNGTLSANGTLTSPILFGPSNGSTEWGTINSAASGASVTLRYVEVIAGRVSVVNGASIMVEDSELHHYYGNSMLGGSGGSFTIRRSHLHHFHDSNINNGSVVAEDMLVEDCDSTDGDPFEMSNSTSVQIRRFTLRRSSGSNADAFDCNSVNNALFEDCLVRSVSDKAISIGTAGGPASQNVLIRNTLIWGARTGLAFKDDSRGAISNVTIANCTYGVQLYPKYTTNTINAGGRLTNFYNNILWNNATQVDITNGTIFVNYSDIGGTNWPGTGNVNVDPQFVNPAAGDYTLGPSSPLLTAGAGGTNMGFTSPIGGIPGRPLNFEAIVTGTNAVVLNWVDDADNETGYVVERSSNGTNYTIAGTTGSNATSLTDSNGTPGVKYYYRVYASNGSGVSKPSNVASARRRGVTVISGGTIGGTITEDVLITAGASVVVNASITVAAGVTFTIEPGATLLFNQGLNFVANGTLIAEGTAENHVIFKPNAGATTWGTLDLFGATNTHRLIYCDILNSSGNIDATSTTIYLDHIAWTNTAANLSQLIDCVSASITLLNSYIPGGSGTEPVHFSSMPANGHALIKGNIFAAPQGYNDSVDFTGGNRPGPIVQFIDNVFLAAVDDCFDMDGTDAHIEGNIFMNVHQDATRDSTANAVSTGADGGNTSELVVVRNIFFDCDHALLMKDAGSIWFENNTVVTIRTNPVARTPAAYMQFGEPHRGSGGGRGVLMNGNIMWDLRSTIPFLWFSNSMFMAANQNIIQGTNITTGTGNGTNDPMFVNWQSGITYQNIKSNLALLPGSPGKGTGPNGLDMGALVPSGASISGEPVGTTTNTSATLKVGGPGIYAYKWKVNSGPWSTEVLLTNNFLITPTMFASAAPITLSNLSDGTYTVYVVGKNSAGSWQDTNSATTSKTWTVSTSVDSDADGLPDNWETNYFPNLSYGANDDPDTDRMTNLQEYQAGTDPNDGASRLFVQIEFGAPNALVSFIAQSNKSYTVQYRDSLATNVVWQRLGDISAGATRTVTLTNLTGQPSRFYRVVTPTVP